MPFSETRTPTESDEVRWRVIAQDLRERTETVSNLLLKTDLPPQKQSEIYRKFYEIIELICKHADIPWSWYQNYARDESPIDSERNS